MLCNKETKKIQFFLGGIRVIFCGIYGKVVGILQKGDVMLNFLVKP